MSPLWIPNREVVFRVRVVRDVRAKLCASPPWFLASDPGPCPPLLLSSSPPPRRGPARVPAGVLAGVPVSRRVSWPGPVGVPAGLPVFRRVSRRGLAGVPAGVPASSSSPWPRGVPMVSRLVSRPPPRRGLVLSRWCPVLSRGVSVGVPWCPGVSRLVPRSESKQK